jgi:hypothetical protein
MQLLQVGQVRMRENPHTWTPLTLRYLPQR